MDTSPYSFNTYFLRLSTLPPSSPTTTFEAYGLIKGTTKVILDYNYIAQYCALSAYKISVRWPGEDTVYLNSQLTTLSTFTPANSALSYYVFSPQYQTYTILNPVVQIYYQNGTIQTINCYLTSFCDNIIDMDMNLLSIQNSNQEYSTIYNLQSNRDNVVYNVTDIIY